VSDVWCGIGLARETLNVGRLRGERGNRASSQPIYARKRGQTLGMRSVNPRGTCPPRNNEPGIAVIWHAKHHISTSTFSSRLNTPMSNRQHPPSTIFEEH